MNETLSEIAKLMQVNKLNVSCSGEKCDVDMHDLPSERVVVNANSVFKAHKMAGKRCDRFLFFLKSDEDKLIVALIELKSGTFKASNVGEQLRNSAKLVFNLLPKNSEIICVPILFHGPGNHKSQFRKLRREKINFGGKPNLISKGKCNDPKNLAKVLSDAKVLP